MVWHIARVQPNSEKRANGWLSGDEMVARGHMIGRGIPTYLPTRTVKMRRGRGRQRVARAVPLFPGYLFVKLERATDFGRVRSTPGVAGFLVVAGEYATVTQKALEAVRRWEPDRIKVGQEVEIVDDNILWSGYRGILKSLDKKDRAVLEVVSAGRAWQVVTSAQMLEPVSHAPRRGRLAGATA